MSNAASKYVNMEHEIGNMEQYGRQYCKTGSEYGHQKALMYCKSIREQHTEQINKKYAQMFVYKWLYNAQMYNYHGRHSCISGTGQQLNNNGHYSGNIENICVEVYSHLV